MLKDRAPVPEEEPTVVVLLPPQDVNKRQKRLKVNSEQEFIVSFISMSFLITTSLIRKSRLKMIGVGFLYKKIVTSAIT